MKTKHLILIGITILIAASVWPANYYLTYKIPNVAKDTIILIYRDYNYSQMMDSLKSSGALSNWKRFERAAKNKDFTSSFKPGRYKLKKEMNNITIMRTISNNWETPLNMTFRGYARNFGRLSLALSKWLEADSASFATALQDTLLRDSLGFTKETYLGMFIPNTYEIYWTTPPKKVIQRFHKEYVRFWNEERLSKAEALGMTPMEVLTLAAIVAEESNYTPEQPTIAGVYINRLNKGMLLQADPTVRFIAIESEPDIKRILRRHLKLESPYNTYINKGLPPGPIITPSVSSIDAVLNYEKHDYIYFCAKPEFDGSHNFASSYTKHLQNAKAYQRAFTARQKAKNAS